MANSAPYYTELPNRSIFIFSASPVLEYDSVPVWACCMTFQVCFYSMATSRKSGFCGHCSILMHTEVGKIPRGGVTSLKSFSCLCDYQHCHKWLLEPWVHLSLPIKWQAGITPPLRFPIVLKFFRLLLRCRDDAHFRPKLSPRNRTGGNTLFSWRNLISLPRIWGSERCKSSRGARPLTEWHLQCREHLG